MGKNRYKELVSNTLIFALGSFGSKLITFFLVPLYTNYLTKEQFGTADFVISCSNLLLPIISLVIQDAVLRFGLSQNAEHDKIAKNAILIFLAGALLTIFLVPLINLYGPLSEWKWYFCAYLISCNAANIMYSFAKSIDKNKLYAICSIVHALTLTTLNILLLVVFPCGIGGYLFANILANSIPAIIVFFASKMPTRILSAKFDWRLLKVMLMYSMPLIANNLSWWVLNSSNRIVIEHYLSVAEVGSFAAASKIPALLSIIVTIFSSAWSISSIKEYESERSKEFFSTVFNCFYMVLFIGASFIILITKPFMMIYVGKEFYDAWIFVPFLLYGIAFYSISSFFGSIYEMVKKNLSITITTLISAIANIGSSIILVPRIGIMGAAIATMIGYMSIGIIRMVHSRKYLKFSFNFIGFIISSVILLLQTIIVSMDFYPIIVSAVSLLLIILVNYRFIRQSLVKIIGMLKEKKL